MTNRQLAKIGVGIQLVLIGGLVLALYLLWPKDDTQIGIDYRTTDEGQVIREKEIVAPGDTFAWIGNQPIKSKISMWLRYTDVNDDGDFDKGKDKVVRRVPASDIPVWGKWDPTRPQYPGAPIRTQLIKNRWCPRCDKQIFPKKKE